MNIKFAFACQVYERDNPKQRAEGFVVSTGSTEYRARRRVLDGFHNSNLFVRKIRCVRKQRIS